MTRRRAAGELLAEGDDGARRMVLQEPPDLAVEALRPQRLELAEALPEALGERIVDAVDQLDRERVDEDRVGAAGLEDAVPERPEQGLGDAGEARVAPLLAHRAPDPARRCRFSAGSFVALM